MKMHVRFCFGMTTCASRSIFWLAILNRRGWISLSHANQVAAHEALTKFHADKLMQMMFHRADALLQA